MTEIKFKLVDGEPVNADCNWLIYSHKRYNGTNAWYRENANGYSQLHHAGRYTEAEAHVHTDSCHGSIEAVEYGSDRFVHLINKCDTDRALWEVIQQRDEARATATRYMEEAERLKTSLERLKDVEREGSIAHLRIRAIVNNCSTPPGMDGYEVTERAVRQAVERAALLAPLSQIAERMDGQDNRATADPIFIVQQRRRVYGMDTDWTGKDIWLYDGEDFAETEDELERFLRENDLGSEEDCLERGDLVKTGYVDTFEFVQPFFSRKAADDYIETNRHNMTDPRVYVDSAYRNKEWQAVRGVLLEMVEKEGTP